MKIRNGVYPVQTNTFYVRHFFIYFTLSEVEERRRGWTQTFVCRDPSLLEVGQTVE